MKLLLEFVKYIAFIGTGFLLCTILVFLLVSLLVFGQPVWVLPFKGAAIFSIIFLWGCVVNGSKQSILINVEGYEKEKERL